MKVELVLVSFIFINLTFSMSFKARCSGFHS